MNKQRRGDFGNDPLKSQASATAVPHEQKAGPALPNYPAGYDCKAPAAKKTKHSFKSKQLKA